MTRQEIIDALKRQAMRMMEPVTLEDWIYVSGAINGQFKRGQAIGDVVRVNAYVYGEYLANEYDTHYAGLSGAHKRQEAIERWQATFAHLDDSENLAAIERVN